MVHKKSESSRYENASRVQNVKLPHKGISSTYLSTHT